MLDELSVLALEVTVVVNSVVPVGCEVEDCGDMSSIVHLFSPVHF